MTTTVQRKALWKLASSLGVTRPAEGAPQTERAASLPNAVAGVAPSRATLPSGDPSRDVAGAARAMLPPGVLRMQGQGAPSAPSAPEAPGGTPAPGPTQPQPQKLITTPLPDFGSSWKGGPGVPDPRDEQYWADVSKSKHNVEVGYAELDVQQTQAEIARRRAMEDLSTKHSQQQKALRQAANKQGRFHGSVLGLELTEEQTAHLRTIFRTDEDFMLAMDALAKQRQLLAQGYSVDEAAALAAASFRYAQKQQAQAEIDAINRQTDAINAANQPQPAGGGGGGSPAETSHAETREQVTEGGGGGNKTVLSKDEYLRRLRAIRERHGANSPEVDRFRQRNTYPGQ